MGQGRSAHLRKSSLWDSALLSMKEIKKTAERTPVTFRDEQLQDPLCITSVRAAEPLFYTSSRGFMLFSFATSWLQWCLHSSSAVNPWAFEGGFQPQSGEKLLLPWEEQEFALHWARDRSLKNNTVPVRGNRELRYLELSKELILGGISHSQIPVPCCTIGSVGSLGGGHCANAVWSFLKPKAAQKKWMYFQFAEIFEVPALVFTAMQSEPETFRNFQYKKNQTDVFFTTSVQWVTLIQNLVLRT